MSVRIFYRLAGYFELECSVPVMDRTPKTVTVTEKTTTMYTFADKSWIGDD